MLGYVIRRLLATIPVVAVVAAVVFLIMRLGPNDPVAAMVGEFASEDQIAEVRARFGFDRSLPEQLLRWFATLLAGDLGTSIYTGLPVSRLIVQRLEPTLLLAGSAMLIAVSLAVPLGVLAAWKAGAAADRAVMAFAVAAFSFPVFLISYSLVLVFSLWLELLPVQGYRPPSDGLGPFLEHIALPAVSLGLIYSALIARITRASVIEVLRQDFVRTARSKGLSSVRILLAHVLRNAAVPIVTVIGIGLAGLISGVVITETVFAIPGIGRLTVDGILNRDYPVIQGVILFFSFVYLGINLVIDIAYAAIDPRIRY
ncbi:ABC transporter permease [Elioraea sp.]|uniref:ABC transporter permease n=1 Tax=Elioraea sp. TaxID=2185103 RepID=UPI003F72E77F